MPDTRYQDRCYSVELLETRSGAFLTIRKDGVIIGEVGVGFMWGNEDALLQVSLKRFKPNEIEDARTADSFD